MYSDIQTHISESHNRVLFTQRLGVVTSTTSLSMPIALVISHSFSTFAQVHVPVLWKRQLPPIFLLLYIAPFFEHPTKFNWSWFYVYWWKSNPGSLLRSVFPENLPVLSLFDHSRFVANQHQNIDDKFAIPSYY